MSSIKKTTENSLKGVLILFYTIIFLVSALFFWILLPETFSSVSILNEQVADSAKVEIDTLSYWAAPAEWRLDNNKDKNQILYGKELISHTAKYLGPKGSVRQISNGMNCQNCHLDAGSKVWGNNYFGVAANFPKFRARSGTKENIVKRVNDCFERSLNGSSLDSSSREMRAIVAYIQWLGSDVQKGVTPNGTGIAKLKFLKRPISPEKGKSVYEAKCQSCHQTDGSGLLTESGNEYTYPPLWGEHSYNSGAGLYRMSNFAGYVKYNMPLGASYKNPQLTDEEAWDLAAYVNSMPRPSKDLSKDWPDISKKPFDHPFGPYSDSFSEEQHKFGPFAPIAAAHKK